VKGGRGVVLGVGIGSTTFAVLVVAACGSGLDKPPAGGLPDGGFTDTGSPPPPVDPPGSGGACGINDIMRDVGVGTCSDLPNDLDVGGLLSADPVPAMTGGMIPDGLYHIAKHLYYTNGAGPADAGVGFSSLQSMEIFTVYGKQQITWSTSFSDQKKELYGGVLCTMGSELDLALRCGAVGGGTLVKLQFSYDSATKTISILGSDALVHHQNDPGYPEVAFFPLLP
jgi:hypothetical protein